MNIPQNTLPTRQQRETVLLGAAVMFIEFTIVVVGLFYKPEAAKAPEMKQENPQ